MTRLLFAAMLVSACTTTIAAEHKPPPPNIFMAPDLGCSVHDYAAATDVPEGATNLGWVQVPREATDEETYVKLREAICAKGGNGLSQLVGVGLAGRLLEQLSHPVESLLRLLDELE